MIAACATVMSESLFFAWLLRIRDARRSPGRHCVIFAGAVVLLVIVIMPAAQPAMAGSDLLRSCRGGPQHGDVCRDDGDCGGGDGLRTGICTRRSMPRACIGTRYCSVSTHIECRGNQDCTADNGGTWPADPADFCPMFQMNVEGCAPAASDTGGPQDCGECAAGAFKGRGCLTDADCAGSPCDKNPGLGNCSDGASQCELERHGHKGYGTHVPHDILADVAVGPPSLGDNIERANSAKTLVSPGAVELGAGSLYVSERRRITRRDARAAARSGGAARDFIGQVDATSYRWLRVGDDANVSIIPLTTAETLHVIHQTGTTVYRPIHCSPAPDIDGCLVGDHHRLLLHPDPMPTDSAARRVWGHRDLEGSRLFGDAEVLVEISGVATMRRCVGGRSIGTPCKGDDSCPASTCASTIVVADRARSRIVVQREPATEDGSAFDFALGQPDLKSAACNTGGRSAHTLCEPAGVTFDAEGNLWVADRGNNRILRFPREFASGSAADRVIGQRDFETTESGTGSTHLRAPADVAFDSHADILFVADTANHRIVRFDRPAEDGVADAVIGQPGPNDGEAGFTSDGTACDRLNGPLSLAVDAAARRVWVTDTVNNRLLAFGYDPKGGVDAAAVVLHGQPDCATKFEGQVDASSIGKGSGGVWFFGEDPQGVCITDELAHRVLCWRDRRRAATNGPVTPPADFILGQEGPTQHRPNRGGDVGADTLNGPSFGSWAARGRWTGALFVADTDNHRIQVYAPPFATGMQAAASIGRKEGAAAECSPAGTCEPNAAKVDPDGNLWVADTGNGRVLLFCHAADTVRAADDEWVCTAANSNDDVADLVLGKPDAGSGFAAGHCSAPTARTLCQPWDVAFDAKRGRVFVGDREASRFGRGRTVVYEAPFATGMAAGHVLGIPSNSLETYDGSDRGFCNGGPTPGAECNDPDDWELRGTTSAACGKGGFCDWSRSFPGNSVAFDAERDTLYVDHGGSIAEILDQNFPPPTPGIGKGVRMQRLFGATNEVTYSNQHIGYTACQWTRQLGQFELDADGNLWAQQGSRGGEHNASVFVTLDPALPRR